MPKDVDIESFWEGLRPKRDAVSEPEAGEPLVVTPSIVKIESPELEVMLGHVFSRVLVSENNQVMTFLSEDGTRFEFYHEQDCCESVQVEDVIGDLADLVGCPLVEADEISSDGFPNPEYGGRSSMDILQVFNGSRDCNDSMARGFQRVLQHERRLQGDPEGGLTPRCN